MNGAVIRFPTETTTWYSLIAPVKSVEEVVFEGKSIYRLLLPILRATEDEEIMAYVYISKGNCADYVPTEGDDVEAVIWLCADLVYQCCT